MLDGATWSLAHRELRERRSTAEFSTNLPTAFSPPPRTQRFTSCTPSGSRRKSRRRSSSCPSTRRCRWQRWDATLPVVRNGNGPLPRLGAGDERRRALVRDRVGKVVVRAELVILADIGESLSLVRPSRNSKGRRIRVVGQEREPVELYTDSRKPRQILVNVARFTPAVQRRRTARHWRRSGSQFHHYQIVNPNAVADRRRRTRCPTIAPNRSSAGPGFKSAVTIPKGF